MNNNVSLSGFVRQNGFVEQQYINVAITYSDDDELKLFEAAKCYETQFTKEEITGLIETETANKTNTKHFRRFSVARESKTDFDF